MSPFAKSNRQIFPGKNFFQRIKLFVWIFLFQKFERKKMSLPKSTCRQCFEAGLQQAVGQSEEEKTLLHLVYFDNYTLMFPELELGQDWEKFTTIGLQMLAWKVSSSAICPSCKN